MTKKFPSSWLRPLVAKLVQIPNNRQKNKPQQQKFAKNSITLSLSMKWISSTPRRKDSRHSSKQFCAVASTIRQIQALLELQTRSTCLSKRSTQLSPWGTANFCSNPTRQKRLQKFSSQKSTASSITFHPNCGRVLSWRTCFSPSSKTELLK